MVTSRDAKNSIHCVVQWAGSWVWAMECGQSEWNEQMRMDTNADQHQMGRLAQPAKRWTREPFPNSELIFSDCWFNKVWPPSSRLIKPHCVLRAVRGNYNYKFYKTEKEQLHGLVCQSSNVLKTSWPPVVMSCGNVSAMIKRNPTVVKEVCWEVALLYFKHLSRLILSVYITLRNKGTYAFQKVHLCM